MNETAIPSEIIRGHVETILLKILSIGDFYGYSLFKTISDITDNAYELKEASLYSGLRRMETQEMIRSYWGDETFGGRRKYYSITEKGIERLNENLIVWQKTKIIMDKVISWGGLIYEQ